MRVVFMGTPAYAVPALQLLAAAPEHEVVAVYTRADAPSGRGKDLRPSEVKAAALELDIPVFTPATLRDAEVQAQIASFEPDVIVVAAFGMILPKEVLDTPRLGCLNIHGSALPRWRGAAPVQRAIFSGDESCGVCIMQMEEGLDTGAFHSCGTVLVGAKGTEEIEAELAHLGAQGLIEALPQVAAGTYEWTVQDEALVTYADKIAKEEMLLSPELTASALLRRIQASSHRAPARCVICGKEAQVTAAQPSAENVAAGQVLIQKKHMILGCADAAVELLSVKPQGKKEMPVMQWANGLRNAESSWRGIGGE